MGAPAADGDGALEGPPRRHALAFVNDSKSHGKVGDSKLSLNEAIQLHNQTLATSKLSKAEKAQISGEGDIAFVDLDPARTKTITLERDLDIIQDKAHGMLLGAVVDPVVILIGSTRGFRIQSDFCDFRNVTLSGGNVAVTLVQDNTIYGSLFENVTFTGQKKVAVDATFKTDSAGSALLFTDCLIEKVPVAIQVHDVGKKRTGRFSFTNTTIRASQIGIDFALGAEGSYTMDVTRVMVQGARTGIRFTRATGASRSLRLLVEDLQVEGAENALRIDGHANATLELGMKLVALAGTKSAATVGGLGTPLKALVQDSRFSGNTSFGGGKDILDFQNCWFGNGSLQLGTSSGGVQLREARLDNVTLTTVGGAAAQLTECCFVGGSLVGLSNAKINGDRCFTGAAKVGSHVTLKNPRAAAQLAKLDVTPTHVAPAGKLDLVADLPKGLVGRWAIGLAASAPTPFLGTRIYLDLNAYVLDGALLRGTVKSRLSVPNLASLKGLYITFHLAVAPASIAAPAFALPPARQILIR